MRSLCILLAHIVLFAGGCGIIGVEEPSPRRGTRTYTHRTIERVYSSPYSEIWTVREREVQY